MFKSLITASNGKLFFPLHVWICFCLLVDSFLFFVDHLKYIYCLALFRKEKQQCINKKTKKGRKAERKEGTKQGREEGRQNGRKEGTKQGRKGTACALSSQ